MFDDLKQDHSQVTTPQSLEPSVSVVASKSANISDMFGDVDPVASEHGSVDAKKPSAIQSGKIKPVSQTSPEVISQTVESSPPIVTAPQKMATPNIPPTDSMMVTDTRSSGIMRKIIIAVLVIFLLAIVGGGVYYFFLRTDGTDLVIDENQNTNIIINEEINKNTNEEPKKIIIDENLLDDDYDGLNNELERTYGTNPLEADSDNDGVFDQDEVEIYHTNPLVDDSDNDTLSDYEEIFIYKTDPNDPDTDGDNFSDGVEVSNGYNPLGSGKLEEVLKENGLNTNDSL